MSPARKIAIVQRFLPGASRGGVGHFTHGLANELVSRGHRVTIYSQDPRPSSALYEVTELPWAGRGRWARLAPLAFPFQISRVDFSGFDLVHAQGDDQLLRRSGQPPVVRTLHGSSLREAVHNGWRRGSPLRALMFMHFYLGELVSDLRADRVVAVSRNTGRDFPRVHAVIPNGVDVRRLAPDGTPKASRPTILFVGELDTRKRGRLLLRTIETEVRPRVPTVQVWVVSPERVDGPGIEWYGQVDEDRLAGLYRAAWLLCLPSSYEGFGRPYVEALAAGTVAVGTRNVGALEVLEDGRDGFVVSDRALGETLYRVLTDAALREELIRRGLARAQAFAWSRVAEQYEGLYDRVLGKPDDVRAS